MLAVASVAFTACGSTDPERMTTSRSTEPIIGGYIDETTSGVVSLGIDVPGHGFIGHCTGALIAPNLVLTARHCIAATNETEERGVVCGETRFTQQGPDDVFLASPDTRRPASLGDPDLYRSSSVRPVSDSDEMCGQDVALIVLEGAGIPASKATPLTPRLFDRAAADEEFSASGFGLTAVDGTRSGVRMRIDGNTVRCAGEDCEGLSRQVRETEWLSIDAPVCSGDSGGPALDSDGRVIGVVSRGGVDCDSVVYGDVASWRDFVIGVATGAAAQGGYAVPSWTVPPPPPAPVDAGAVEEEEEEEEPEESSAAPRSGDDGGCSTTQLAGSRRALPGAAALALSLLMAVRAWGGRRRRCDGPGRRTPRGSAAST